MSAWKQAGSDGSCCPLQELRAQFQAMVDDTTQQQAGLVKRLKEQHAAEVERKQRQVQLLANPHPLPVPHLAAAAQHISKMQWLLHLALHLAHMQTHGLLS